MPEQPSKQQMIIDYIRNISEQLNQQYSGIMNRDRYDHAVEMFKDSELPYEEVVEQINALAQQVVKSYLEEREKRFNPELVKQNHEEIYSKLEVLVKKLNERGIDYQLAGALCAYIKYGVESNRTHDDIDINLNEADMNKFRQVCEEMGLQFHDDRLTTPRVLKNGIPAGDHEVIATLDGSDFHIGAFCFERKPDGTIVNKGYYHDESGQVYTRDDVMPPELASEIFGREQVDFRGQKLTITPPEYVYRLKNYTKKDKDLTDIMFMEGRIDKDKLERISELSKTSRIEHTKVDVFGQSFNYHTHTYRSGHSEYASDEEMLQAARDMGISMIGFSEHIPNPDLVLPDEDHRMLSSEVDGYIASISKMKQEHHDMTILAGFEAEYDPMREAFLGEMRDKVDYMILGQHFVSGVKDKGNSNYPIEYADMVCNAMESGIFDIIAHPDIFMKLRDTMETPEAKKAFQENSLIASQAICDKAKELGIPLEINFGGINKKEIMQDWKISYPYSEFWQIASETGVPVLYGVDAHLPQHFNNMADAKQQIDTIVETSKLNFVDRNYNPVEARKSNKKLNELYTNGQAKALTYETHLISQITNGIMQNIPDEHFDSETFLFVGEQALNNVSQDCTMQASVKDQQTLTKIEQISSETSLSMEEKTFQLTRSKSLIEHTNNTLSHQQAALQRAKESIHTAAELGCQTKSEIINTVVQLTELKTTKSEETKNTITNNIQRMQQVNNGLVNPQSDGPVLVKTNNTNGNKGFIDVISLTLIITFICGVAVGIGYMLYKISIG